MPKHFYCDLSCVAERQDIAQIIDCQNDMNLMSLAAGDGPYDGQGPGCAIMTDASGFALLKKGPEWFMQNLVGLNTTAPPAPGYRLTIWGE